MCVPLSTEWGWCLFLAQQNAEAGDTLASYKRILLVFISISHHNFASSNLANLALTFSLIVVEVGNLLHNHFSAVLTTIFFPLFSIFSDLWNQYFRGAGSLLALSTVSPHLRKAFIYVSIYCFRKRGFGLIFQRKWFFFLKEQKLFSEWISCCLSSCTLSDAKTENCHHISASCWNAAQPLFTPTPTDLRGISRDTPSFQQKFVAIPYLSLPVFSSGQVGWITVVGAESSPALPLVRAPLVGVYANTRRFNPPMVICTAEPCSVNMMSTLFDLH